MNLWKFEGVRVIERGGARLADEVAGRALGELVDMYREEPIPVPYRPGT